MISGGIDVCTMLHKHLDDVKVFFLAGKVEGRVHAIKLGVLNVDGVIRFKKIPSADGVALAGQLRLIIRRVNLTLKN